MRFGSFLNKLGMGKADSGLLEMDVETFSFNLAKPLPRNPTFGSGSCAGRLGGMDKTNHDKTLITNITGDTNLWAVFDGHGENGITCAENIANMLPNAMNEVLER